MSKYDAVISMKIDDVTLQNILKAYGKEMKPTKTKAKVLEILKNEAQEKKITPEDLDIINYNKDGKTAVNSKQKDALIDFFQ